MRVGESGWKWMKVDESGWKWMKVDEMDKRGWKWMKVNKMDENGWNGMTDDESGLWILAILYFTRYDIFMIDIADRKGCERKPAYHFSVITIVTKDIDQISCSNICQRVIAARWLGKGMIDQGGLHPYTIIGNSDQTPLIWGKIFPVKKQIHCIFSNFLDLFKPWPVYKHC